LPPSDKQVGQRRNNSLFCITYAFGMDVAKNSRLTLRGCSDNFMRNCWIFFRDVFGYWQWERHGDDMVAVESSDAPFEDAGECRHDAIQRGYLPMMHAAIFPPEFESSPSSERCRVAYLPSSLRETTGN